MRPAETSEHEATVLMYNRSKGKVTAEGPQGQIVFFAKDCEEVGAIPSIGQTVRYKTDRRRRLVSWRLVPEIPAPRVAPRPRPLTILTPPPRPSTPPRSTVTPTPTVVATPDPEPLPTPEPAPAHIIWTGIEVTLSKRMYRNAPELQAAVDFEGETYRFVVEMARSFGVPRSGETWLVVPFRRYRLMVYCVAIRRVRPTMTRATVRIDEQQFLPESRVGVYTETPIDRSLVFGTLTSAWDQGVLRLRVRDLVLPSFSGRSRDLKKGRESMVIDGAGLACYRTESGLTVLEKPGLTVCMFPPTSVQ